MLLLMMMYRCVHSNSLRGSAVCAFKMADIVSSFEGAHKEQKTAHSNWLPVRDVNVPKPRPARVSDIMLSSHCSSALCLVSK